MSEPPKREEQAREWWFSAAPTKREQDTTSGAGQRSAGPALPSISLPKGGGAIKGIDEKVTVNQATGTAALSVAAFTSPGRSGFGPSLGLSYDSGAGNGPLGLGWSISAPHITRKTSKGLPLYDDGGDSDVFVLSGAEDLVPLIAGGQTTLPPTPRRLGAATFDVRAYRPRVESGFARIERWQNTTSGEVHWRSISRENVTSLYGQDASSRIADPEDLTRVFTWLLDLSFDDRGNAISYVYKPEDEVGVPVAANEANRLVAANRYLKRVRYGNRKPYEGVLPAEAGWCFELVLDYGEHDLSKPTPDDTQAPWTCRGDAFSTYRSCFEVRTYRRCRRLLMFHNFATGEAPAWVPVRSTDLTYEAVPADPSLPYYSLIESITQTGWMPDGAGGYETSRLPPIELGYQPPGLDQTGQFVDAFSLENVTGSGARWTDVNGEGLKGLLTEDESAWYYKRNVSTWNREGGPTQARFEPLVVVAEKPSVPGLTLTDLNGDGNLCAVKLAPPDPGWFEYTPDTGWSPFRSLQATASVDWQSPELRIVDVTGDGLADVLICEDEAFSWHEWIVDSGFSAAARVPKPFDEERGPALIFADPTACVFLADMSGDGLTDLVRIRSGGVCYWPNIGYGRFGAKVTMDASPAFDFSDRFDARRVRLADIDGTGTADLLYLAEDVRIWFNQSGGSWTEPQILAEAPRFDQGIEMDVMDLLGTGTSCLVWSSAFPADAQRSLRYIDLTRGQKPFLLRTVKNSFGTEKTITYAPSTKFYVQDLEEEKPWLTRLPFPVHVVEQIETTDAVSATSYTSSYSYHHGYYDGIEREFRGFACVEATDADLVPSASGIGGFSSTPGIRGEEFDLPPVLTRTWFHTGAFFGWGDIAAHLQLDYWSLDPAAPQLAPTVMPTGLSPEGLREAARALRGRVLREEVYAIDETPAQGNPYVTKEHRYQVQMLQPPTAEEYGSFYSHELEAVSCEYEREPGDPRINHSLTFAVDEWGDVTEQATVAYGRPGTEGGSQQGLTVLRYVQSDFAQLADASSEPDVYRVGVPIETRAYELSGIVAPVGTLYDPLTLGSAAAAAVPIAYEAAPGNGPQCRLLSRHRTYYRQNNLKGALALGAIESLALVDASYTQRYTPGLIANVYGGVLDTSLLTTAGALVELDRDGSLWAPSSKVYYTDKPAAANATVAAEGFYLPRVSIDPWGNETTVTYDFFQLLVTSSVDAAGNRTDVENNYRVLAPWLLTDSNLNRSGVRFNGLGLVSATAAMGKLLEDGTDEGDSLDTASDEPSAADSPTVKFTYALEAYTDWAGQQAPDPRHPTPVSVQTQTRIEHKQNPCLLSISYMDGLGRIALTKAQAEPGPAPQWAADGTLVKVPGSSELALAHSVTRWVGTGRVVYDNKGNPVKAYEPFFDSEPDYVIETELVEWGVTAITQRDPLGRVIRVDNPDGTFREVRFGPWRSETYDENDTVGVSDWYKERSGGLRGQAELEAAEQALPDTNTPSTTDLDPLGRTFQSTADNGPRGSYTTVFELDIDGNQLVVKDALGRAALTRCYDMAKSELYSSSIDAGDRRVLIDTGGQPIQASDSRGFIATMQYDALRRPTELLVESAGVPGSKRLAEKVVYGETLGFGAAQAPARNLCGVAYQHYDQAGIASTDERDLQGNVISSTRELLALDVYSKEVDWSTPPKPGEKYTTKRSFDALNRPIRSETPDGSIATTAFNARSLIESVALETGGVITTFVKEVAYDAKGQREEIVYGNGASTTYKYDPETFRLISLQTSRPGGENPLQELTYTYDPVGNVAAIADGAQTLNFYKNAVVPASAKYEYDAIYRLVTATGREHIGQTTTTPLGWDDSARAAFPVPLNNDALAMRNYTQEYTYDPVGNITATVHRAGGTGWNRSYKYPTASNRVESTVAGGLTEAYEYDGHGNIIKMPHLTKMEWDWKDQLSATARQRVAEGEPETTYYRYDGAGQRVVKATYSEAGAIVARRVYLGGYELYREYGPQGEVTLERQSVQMSDGRVRIALVETAPVEDSKNVVEPSALQRYQLGNHLGSAVIELDSNAQTISYEEYYPYGSTSFQLGRTAVEVSLKRYRYTGKERDSENAFYYHGARYYAPWLGRWVSTDPASGKGGQTLYSYAAQNPIHLVDPDGRDPTPGFWATQAQYWSGVGQGAHELATGVATMVAHPINTAAAIVAQSHETFEAAGGGFKGAIDVANQFNPVYNAAVAGIEYYNAAQRGDAKEAGHQAFRAVTNIASLATLGGAGVAGLGGEAAGAGFTLKLPMARVAQLAGGFGPGLVPAGEAAVSVSASTVGAVAAVAKGTVLGGTGLMMARASGPPGPSSSTTTGAKAGGAGGSGGSGAGGGAGNAGGSRPRSSLGRTFMEDMRKAILAGGDAHPFHQYLDEKGKWLSRSHLSESPTAQAGHIMSHASGAPEAFALEDSFFNQFDSWTVESKGGFLSKVAVEVEGVVAELRTARLVLGREIADALPRHTGWTGK
jgi:RHS repeat-associated protein